jgi:von Willebrand factor type A domain
MKTAILKIVLLVLGVAMLLAPALADETKAVTKTKNIELVICLDTSNSMDGLIDSAKRKLWEIVNELAKAKPTPNLQVGLFSYGNDNYDPKTGWVRKELDLTSDLDKVSEKLFGLTTRGGTEYVGRVTRDAVEQIKWSDDTGTLKIIFVCGNEAATQDPEVKLPPLAQVAIRKGIIINTIYCAHGREQDRPGWKEFADLSEGRFASIDQKAGTVAIATPYDKELAGLGGELNLTFCFVGRDKKELADNQVRQDENAAKLGLEALAARSESKSGRLYKFEADLVHKLAEDPKFDVKKVPESELSDELKKMTPEEREKHVKGLLAKREEVQKKIAELTKKRAEHIAAEQKKNAGQAEKAFDEAVRAVVGEQARKKGFEIPEQGTRP